MTIFAEARQLSPRTRKKASTKLRTLASGFLKFLAIATYSASFSFGVRIFAFFVANQIPSGDAIVWISLKFVIATWRRSSDRRRRRASKICWKKVFNIFLFKNKIYGKFEFFYQILWKFFNLEKKIQLKILFFKMINSKYLQNCIRQLECKFRANHFSQIHLCKNKAFFRPASYQRKPTDICHFFGGIDRNCRSARSPMVRHLDHHIVDFHKPNSTRFGNHLHQLLRCNCNRAVEERVEELEDKWISLKNKNLCHVIIATTGWKNEWRNEWRNRRTSGIRWSSKIRKMRIYHRCTTPTQW